MSKKKHAPDRYDDVAAGDAAARIAAYLGSQEEWRDPGDALEVIAGILNSRGGFRHPGSDENTAYYVHQQELYDMPEDY